jgi:Rrf2 family protein
MMKLTRASSYALHAVVYMAAQKHLDQPIASHTIAHERKIPDRFLLKVLKPLVSHQILTSIKGPNGGYRLIKKPSEITMLDVIEAADGAMIRGEAPVNKEDPNNPLDKYLGQICSQTAEQIRKQLAKVKISELANNHR